MDKKIKKKVGRPPKTINKLTRSINLKLSEMDYANVQEKAEKLNLTPTQYAREKTLKGYVKQAFTNHELALMRNIAGVTCNLNQFVKVINSGEMRYKLTIFAIILELKKILDDSKKH